MISRTFGRPRPRHTTWAGSCFWILLLSLRTLSAQEAGPAKPAPTDEGSNSSQRREFAPGVVIDWKQKAVEVDARVVLREGPLELFACSPQTKEHESVIAIVARPFHLFQAMGLVGLETGSPPRYDEKLGRWFPASGEPLDLRIRWRDGHKDRTASPAAWMIEKKTGKAPDSLRWVFAGSLTGDEGGFAADGEGTVACVVDFESALIAQSVRHSADDAELWLSANPKEVPPVGTRCTLIVRSAYHPKLELEIESAGRFRSGEESWSIDQIGDQLSRQRDDRTPFLVVSYRSGMDESEIKRAVANLEGELRRRNINPATSMKLRTAPSSLRDAAQPKVRE